MGQPAATGVPVRADGLVGTWFPPASGRKGPAILVLGGSEGGERSAQLLARALARQGYGAFALAYFKVAGLPPALQRVPLEYFDRALGWLRAQPLVDPAAVGLYGVSIGGETALVVAARNPSLRAVVAAVPSSVVWQGFDETNYTSVASTYSLAGQEVPYLPYDMRNGFTSVHALYAVSLNAIDQHPAAIIPVERIGGALLLLSARADALWPSTLMSEQVVARLRAKKFARPYRHVAFDDAGHGVTRPPSEQPADESTRANLGGTEAGNAAARVGMWRETLAHFAAYLGATGDRKGGGE